jgi:rubrerythrin
MTKPDVPRSRQEAKTFVEELIGTIADSDQGPTLLNFGFGSQFHKEVMQELFPELAARMPLEEQHLFCTRCGHRDERWYGASCPICGKKLV